MAFVYQTGYTVKSYFNFIVWPAFSRYIAVYSDDIQRHSAMAKREVPPVTKLLDSVTAAATGEWVQLTDATKRAIQATVAGTGSVSATVIIEVSNDAVGAITAGTITLSGTTNASDGFVLDAPWRYARARLTAISGTGAVVTSSIGV